MDTTAKPFRVEQEHDAGTMFAEWKPYSANTYATVDSAMRLINLLDDTLRTPNLRVVEVATGEVLAYGTWWV